MTVAIPHQVTFDDLLHMAHTLEPQFAKGDTIYIRSLDVVLCGTVSDAYICGARNEKPYYGYHVDIQGGRHTCVWDYLVGDTVFCRKQSALRKAESLHFDKILPEQIASEECRSFEYIRDLDNHRLTAAIGKIGNCELYEHDFMCYHFIRIYSSQKKRDEAYQKLLNKMEMECAGHDGMEIQAVFEPLYRVKDDLYASREYAEHNGIIIAKTAL